MRHDLALIKSSTFLLFENGKIWKKFARTIIECAPFDSRSPLALPRARRNSFRDIMANSRDKSDATTCEAVYQLVSVVFKESSGPNELLAGLVHSFYLDAVSKPWRRHLGLSVPAKESCLRARTEGRLPSLLSRQAISLVRRIRGYERGV
jgi:hypothetical protein